MSDWRETKESQEQQVSHEATGEKLSPRGIGAMQGNVDTQEQEVPEAPEQPGSDDDLITIHPHQNPETLPSPEVQPTTIRNPEEGKPKPPKGWRPGGVEDGG